MKEEKENKKVKEECENEEMWSWEATKDTVF